MLPRLKNSALLRVKVNSEKSLIVDKTHLELVSGELVLLQKTIVEGVKTFMFEAECKNKFKGLLLVETLHLN